MALEPVDPAFDRVSLLVVGLVERRWPAASGAEFLMVADPVRGDRDGRPDPASSQVGPLLWESYALSALTRSGRVRGRPRPSRGTRIASRTGSNCGESSR